MAVIDEYLERWRRIIIGSTVAMDRHTEALEHNTEALDRHTEAVLKLSADMQSWKLEPSLDGHI